MGPLRSRYACSALGDIGRKEGIWVCPAYVPLGKTQKAVSRTLSLDGVWVDYEMSCRLETCVPCARLADRAGLDATKFYACRIPMTQYPFLLIRACYLTAQSAVQDVLSDI